MTSPSNDRYFDVDVSGFSASIGVQWLSPAVDIMLPPRSLAVETEVSGTLGFVHCYLYGISDNGYSYPASCLAAFGSDMPGDENDIAWAQCTLPNPLPFTQYKVGVVPIAHNGTFNLALDRIRFTIDYGLLRSYPGAESGSQ